MGYSVKSLVSFFVREKTIYCLILFPTISLQACINTSNLTTGTQENYVKGDRTLKKQYNPKLQIYIAEDSSYRISSFVRNIATVSKDGLFGIIDTNGVYVSEINQKIQFFGLCSEIGTLQVSPPSIYQPINSVCDGGFAGTYVVCDKDGNILVPYILANTHEPITTNMDLNLIYLIKHDNRTKTDGSLRDEVCEKSGLCLGTWGIINCNGKIISPFEYLYIGLFSEGYAQVVKGEKHGFINTLGMEVIPCNYDGSTKFKSGLASIKLNGRWGMIDNNNNVIIPIMYDFFIEFDDETAKVTKDGVSFYINKKGERIP